MKGSLLWGDDGVLYMGRGRGRCNGSLIWGEGVPGMGRGKSHRYVKMKGSQAWEENGVACKSCTQNTIATVITEYCDTSGCQQTEWDGYLRSGIIPHMWRWPDSPQPYHSPVNSIKSDYLGREDYTWSKCFQREHAIVHTNDRQTDGHTPLS